MIKKINTIHGSLHKLRNELPDTIYLSGRRLYREVKFREEGEHRQAEVTRKLKQDKIREEDFYEAYGDWLIKPIPLIYMRERSDGKIEVVDGQQGLDAVFDFFNSRYALTGLSILKGLNGKRFRDFETGERVLQRK